MKHNRSLWIGAAVLLMLSGCGQQDMNGTDADVSSDMSASDVTTEQTTATNTILQPSDLSGYRKISEELPKVSPKVVSPGTREHFSFTDEDQTYVFTETNNLWLYNQSVITDLHTEFLLNMNGNKITIVPLSAEDKKKVQLSQYNNVYEDEKVTIYRGRIMNDGDNSGSTSNAAGSAESDMDEAEPMYLTLYNLVYQVNDWQNLVKQGALSSNTLYQGLAQMGTAIEKTSSSESLTNVLDGYRGNPVFADYYFAYREGLTHTGFLYCSPNTNTAKHDNYIVYMSVYIPDWDTYAVVHVEPSPKNVSSLEDTGVTYDDRKIVADYAGDLKYYLIGDDGRCIYIEGAPGEAGSSDKAYTAKEVAYIFDLVLTK